MSQDQQFNYFMKNPMFNVVVGDEPKAPQGAVTDSSGDLLTEFPDLFNLNNRNRNSKLASLQTVLPYLPIAPIPAQNYSVMLDANKPIDIDVPEDAQLVRFFGNPLSGNVFVDFRGQASVPALGVVDKFGAILNPFDQYFFCDGLRSFSLISDGNSVFATVAFFTQI